MSGHAPQNFSSHQKFALVMLCMNQFMFTCAFAMIAPFYPKEASQRGCDEVLAGLILSFYTLLIFCAAPIFGKLAPKYGVKTTLMTGLVTAGIGNILFGTLRYITNKNLFALFSFVFRTVEALGATAFVTTSNIVVSGVFPNNVGFVRGIIEIFISLGFSLGPALGGLLYSLGGFQLPFMLLGIVMIQMAPLNERIKFTEGESSSEKESGLILKMLRVPSVILTSIILITISVTWTFLDPTLEPHLRKYELSPEYIGLIFLMYSGTFGLAGCVSGWFSDKKPKYKWYFMMSGMIVVCITLLALGPTRFQSFLEETLSTNLIALAVLGASLGFALMPTYQCFMDGAIEAGLKDNVATQSVTSALWVCSYTFGNVIGPVSAGLLYTNRGFAFTTDILAFINLIVVVMIIADRMFCNVKK